MKQPTAGATPPENAKKRHLTNMQLYKMLLFRIDERNEQEGCTTPAMHAGCPLSYVAVNSIRNYVKGKIADGDTLLSVKRKKAVCEYYGIFIQSVKYSVLC